MKIKTIIMETRASRSSLFLRESWPVLDNLEESSIEVERLKIQRCFLPPNNNKIICQLAVYCLVQTKQKDQGKNDDKDKMTPKNVDLEWIIVHVWIKSIAYVDKGRVVSPLCPGQTAAVLDVEVLAVL